MSVCLSVCLNTLKLWNVVLSVTSYIDVEFLVPLIDEFTTTCCCLHGKACLLSNVFPDNRSDISEFLTWLESHCQNVPPPPPPPHPALSFRFLELDIWENLPASIANESTSLALLPDVVSPPLQSSATFLTAFTPIPAGLNSELRVTQNPDWSIALRFLLSKEIVS